MKKFFIFILSLALIVTVFSSCQQPETTQEKDGITVVTTIFPVYDWTCNVAGDNCNVIYLDESGTDMHSFEPTAKDILTLAQADVFIHIGGVSDEWVEGAIESANNPELITLSLMDVTGVLEEEIIDGMEHDDDDDHDTAEYDEHIWLSLRKAKVAVSAIAETLSKADNANKDKYTANAENYNAKLTSLDGKFSDCVNNAKQKTLLFADRFPFRYFTEDYSLEYFAAFPGCSAESEASFETMTFLIEKTKELSLPCILIIENSDSRIAQTISNETGAEILSLNSCQSVTKNDIDNGMTYLSAMEKNLQTITEALG
ncbi:MAG: zinc ABC transporter substrate-binding protein [Clostridia bacterium]|nr:zinc ABC transporter substrate-binding protein [Clostridia bacterium]